MLFVYLSLSVLMHPLEAVLWSLRPIFLTLPVYLPLFPAQEPICPIVGSKEALCGANEIKAHLAEGIKRPDRFNRARVEREGDEGGGMCTHR